MSTVGSANSAAKPGRVQSSIDQVKADIRGVRNDAAETGRDLARAVRSGVADGKDRAAELLGAARDRAARAAASARERAESAAASARDAGGRQVEHLRDTIAQRPLTSVGIALGVGLVLGMMCPRRS